MSNYPDHAPVVVPVMMRGITFFGATRTCLPLVMWRRHRVGFFLATRRSICIFYLRRQFGGTKRACNGLHGGAVQVSGFIALKRWRK